MYQTDGRKTWMLRDIFLKSGIIDCDGNIYESPHCDAKVYKYCFGTELAAIERGLELRKDARKPKPKGMKKRNHFLKKLPWQETLWLLCNLSSLINDDKKDFITSKITAKLFAF